MINYNDRCYKRYERFSNRTNTHRKAIPKGEITYYPISDNMYYVKYNPHID